MAIEVKGAGRVSPRDLRGLRAFSEETQLSRQIVVCDEADARKLDGVDVLPYADFLRALWEDRIVEGG